MKKFLWSAVLGAAVAAVWGALPAQAADGAADPDSVFLRDGAKPRVSVLAKMAGENVEAKAKAEAEAKAKAEEEARQKAEAEAKAKAEEEARIKAEEEARAKAEAEAKAKAEEEARQKAEAEAKAKAEEEARLKAEEEARAKAEEEARQKAEAEAKAKAEEEARQKAEAEANAKAKEEARAKYLENPDPDERPDVEPAAEGEGEAAPKAEEPPKSTIMDSLPGVNPIEKKKKADKKPKPEPKVLTGRDAVITAERTDYDRKEGVILFDRKVYVDDEQYQLHADRLFVFLDGTNSLKRIVALGNVAMTNDMRSALCSRATYVKATGKVVLYGEPGKPAILHEDGDSEKDAAGDRIVFWLNSEEVNVDNPVIRLPGSTTRGGGGLDVKDILLGK